uniref:F-box protein AT5G49610-like beta-propeller domain-containing protein n=1 Tax=Arundo donax TaxID=35708 RepID=A0A0A8YPM8_ARUDO
MIIPRSSTVVDNAIYWMLDRQGILEFHLNMQSLSFIKLPLVDADVDDCFKWQIMGAKGGQLGLAILADLSIQFWERETNHGKHARWLLRKTVQSDNFLPAGCSPISILGFAEESKAIFLTTGDGLFMVHLETMQYRKVLEEAEVYQIIPY